MSVPEIIEYCRSKIAEYGTSRNADFLKDASQCLEEGRQILFRALSRPEANNKKRENTILEQQKQLNALRERLKFLEKGAA